MLTDRKLAMKWWNNLTEAQKVQVCVLDSCPDPMHRKPDTLTGREVQRLYIKWGCVECGGAAVKGERR